MCLLKEADAVRTYSRGHSGPQLGKSQGCIPAILKQLVAWQMLRIPGLYSSYSSYSKIIGCLAHAANPKAAFQLQNFASIHLAHAIPLPRQQVHAMSIHLTPPLLQSEL